MQPLIKQSHLHFWAAAVGLVLLKLLDLGQVCALAAKLGAVMVSCDTHVLIHVPSYLTDRGARAATGRCAVAAGVRRLVPARNPGRGSVKPGTHARRSHMHIVLVCRCVACFTRATGAQRGQSMLRDHARCSRTTAHRRWAPTKQFAYICAHECTCRTHTWLLHCVCVAGEHGGGDYKLVLLTPTTRHKMCINKHDDRKSSRRGLWPWWRHSPTPSTRRQHHRLPRILHHLHAAKLQRRLTCTTKTAIATIKRNTRTVVHRRLDGLGWHGHHATPTPPAPPTAPPTTLRRDHAARWCRVLHGWRGAAAQCGRLTQTARWGGEGASWLWRLWFRRLWHV